MNAFGIFIRIFSTAILMILVAFPVFAQQKKISDFSGKYFGLTAPVDQSEIFMDGLISLENEAEMCAAFTKDGLEFYYNAQHNGRFAIFITRELNGRWTEPKLVLAESDYIDRDFTMSPDGNVIVFGSNRPKPGSTEEQERLDIFRINRNEDGTWSDPVNIGSPVNTIYSENYPCLTNSGNLYYFSFYPESSKECDLYVSRFVDGRYQEPERLSDNVNSEKHDWDAYIAPDESYIIFSSMDRDDTIGGMDIYISYRNRDGSWTNALNMGRRINSTDNEICPSVSLDGSTLFFTSRRRGGTADIFWIDAKIIDDLSPFK